MKNLPPLIKTLIFAILSLSHLQAQDTTQPPAPEAPTVPRDQAAFEFAEQYYAAGINQRDPYKKSRYLNFAIQKYREFLRTHGRSTHVPAVRFHLGHARQTLGHVEESRNTYRTLIRVHKRGPYVGSAARQLAYLYYAEENWKQAAKYFGIAAIHLKQDKYKHSALTKQVQCLMKLNDPNAVNNALTKIMKMRDHPYQDWARFLFGYRKFNNLKYQECIDILDPLTSADSESKYRSQAVFYTGLCTAELGIDHYANDHLLSILEIPLSSPDLTAEQKKHLPSNKAQAQTALMGFHTRKKNWDQVIKLYEMGDFGAKGKREGMRNLRAGNGYYTKKSWRSARSAFRRADRFLAGTKKAYQASFKCLICDYHLQHPGLAERVDVFFELYFRKFGQKADLEVARFIKAESLFNRKEVEAAAGTYKRVKEEHLDEELHPELFFKRGWSFNESGKHDGAIRNFTLFIDRYGFDPRIPEAYNKRAESHLALGDLASAFGDYDAVLRLDTSKAQTAFALQGGARVLRKMKKYQPMIDRYRKILADFPNMPKSTIANANYWIAWGYFHLKEYQKVAPYAEKARNLAPEYLTPQVGDLLVVTAFNQKDKHRLHSVLQDIYKTAPEKKIPSNMLSWLGVQMFHDGQIQTAANYLTKATDPDVPKRTDPGVWRTLAKAQNRTQQFAQAETTSRLLLDLEKSDLWKADAYLDLSEALLGQNKYDEALEAATNGLTIKAKGAHTAGLHQARGEVYVQKRKWAEALKDFETTINIVPDDPVLQPKALHGAYLTCTELDQAGRASVFKNRLKSKYPNWEPTFTLPEDEPTPPKAIEIPEDEDDSE